MTPLLLLMVCLLLGVGVGRFATPPPALPQSLNWWVLNIALPALILHLLPLLKVDLHLWVLPAAMWLVFFGAWGLFAVIGKRLGWSRGQIGALTLVCGLGNTSFIAYPMIEALRGQAGLTLAVVADQIGCFPALVIGGTVVAATYSGGKPNARQIAQKILWFPPFLCFIVGFIAGRLGGWPPALDEMLARIGATLVPLALFSVGLQLKLRLAPGQMSVAIVGLCWKLFVAAGLVFGLGLAFGINREILTIAVLQTAMAPMISAAILADQYDLDPPLANAVLSIGIVISFVSVPLINLLL